jgi:3',5'-cyclic AMP phosphodiesterase CpdA
MRALIIPDLHHHTENAEYWLKTQSYDRVIFLGDFFDDFGDNANDARQTAFWLRNRMDSSDDIMLLGNHDAAYMFPHLDALYCSGFSRAKARAIQEVLEPRHWQRFKLAHAEQGWLLSHAGFHPAWIKTPAMKPLIDLGGEVMAKAGRGVVDPLLGAGFDRGGSQPFGGPLWLDWDSFVPTPGLNQIVGHTPGAEVREKHMLESENYCLDVRNGAAAAILEDGNVSTLRR